MTEPDPFSGSESAPAISFADAPIGTIRRVKITDAAKLVQSRDFDTGDPAFWPDGNKKMSAVVNGEDENGLPCSVWAAKPSSLFTAIQDAQKAVAPDYRLKAGDELVIKFDSEKPNAKNPRLNPQKIYKAKVTPGAPPAPPTEDPWGSTAPADDSPPF